MESDQIMPTLLRETDWGDSSALLSRFRASAYFPPVLTRLSTLRRDALFVSEIHGQGHIERVIVHGGLCAMEEGLSDADTALLLDVCAYHDVGRKNDDWDEEHGARSALRLGELTGRTGRDLALIQAAADAHARPERQLRDVLARHGLGDDPRALALTQLLKDADGLDRVRIGDLNPAMLRRDFSRRHVPFAELLFRRYQLLSGKSPEPYFTQEELAAFRADVKRRARAQAENSPEEK